MKKGTARRGADELRPEYDLAKLGKGVRGKYYDEAIAGTNLVLIEPELAEVFPSSESVNRALRALVDTAAATVGRRSRHRASEAQQRTAAKRKSVGGRRAGRLADR